MPDINQIQKTGLGTSRIASLGGSMPQSEFNAFIKTALENNVNLIDTADTYGSGDSEKMIGKALNGARNEFFVITKAGFPHTSLPGWMSPLNQVGKKILQKLNRPKNYSKYYLIRSLHRSLKRLKTDAVDAFLLHEPKFAELTDDTWEALEFIRNKGMARYTGIAGHDERSVEAAIKSGQTQIVETPISLLQKEFSVVDLCHNHNIPVVANQVLFKLNDLKKKQETEKVLSNHNLALHDLPHIMIAFASSRRGIKNTLIGTRNPKHLADNAKVRLFDEKLYIDLQNLK